MQSPPRSRDWLSMPRYWLAHLRGLLRRGLSSLRSRGWRATWQRAWLQLRPAPPPPVTLYRPAPLPFAPLALPPTVASPTPRASIVIPVYNHCQATLACLRALAAHPPATACEVIVVDDGSSDDTAAWMAQVDGLRYHRRAANGGFIAACNDGAAQARGRFLVFLNNDTLPQPGWLDALLATFDAQPDTGMAVAQLLYPDGRLQEAGGVVFADGSAWSYGRFESADDPRYAYVREADYGSGAALAIPRALFARAGGFDPRYAPAYYEDTDLAFAVRALGARVRYQPASRVLHDEGTTAGTDTGSGVKAYQARNRQVFADKWAHALRGQPAASTVPGPALLHAQQRSILFVDEAVPTPDRDSASLRQFNLLRMLRGHGAHVAFLPTGLAHAGADTLPCSNWAWKPGTRHSPARWRPGCAPTPPASRSSWSAATIWPPRCCRCCAGMRHWRGWCWTRWTCTTCANTAEPCCPAIRRRCVRPKPPAGANWRRWPTPTWCWWSAPTSVPSCSTMHPASRWRCCPTCTRSPAPAPASMRARTWSSWAASAIRPTSMRCCGSCRTCSRPSASTCLSCDSIASAIPRTIWMAASSGGSSIFTTWKRRASGGTQ